MFSCAKGLAAITGPFIAAALHPKSALDDHEAGPGGWSGYGFTGAAVVMLRDGLRLIMFTAMTIFVGSGMIATAALSGTVLAFRKKGMKSE